jgi:hypothetical protein
VRYLSFIIPFFFILSCDKQINPKLESSDVKLYIQADFNFINGITVYVLRALPSTTKSFLNKDINIVDARVYLKDSISGISWLLTYDTTYNFYQNFELKPLLNNSYQIVVDFKGQLLSSLVTYTPSIPVFRVNKKSKEPVVNFTPGFKLNYSVSATLPSKDQFYSLGRFLKSQNFDNHDFAFIEYLQREELCGYQNNVLPGICLNGFEINLELQGYIWKREYRLGVSSDLLYKGKHYIYISSISPRYYHYLQATREPDPFERYFYNPSVTPTDFPGAFGTFLIRNMAIIDSITIQ